MMVQGTVVGGEDNMNRGQVVGVLVCVAASACSQCGKTQPPPDVPVFVEMTPDSGPGRVDADSVEFGLTLNDATSTQLHVGWPAVVTLHGLWTGDEPGLVGFERSDVQLHVINESGSSESWPWVVDDGASSWTLTRGGEVAQIRWSLDASQAAALRVGKYRLEAAWKERRSEALEIEVVAAPSNPSTDERSRRAQLASRVATLRGDAAGAERELNDGLQGDPDDVNLLYRKALALEAKGDLKAAYAIVQRALVLAENFDAPAGAIVEPPISLELLASRLDRELFKQFMTARDGGR